MHQLLDAHQPLAQLAARMQAGEVFLLEALGDEQRHGQRVAERQRRSRAGRRHQIQRAGFLRDAAVE